MSTDNVDAWNNMSTKTNVKRQLPPSRMEHVNFKSSNKYLQVFQQLKVPTDIYKSSNNITVPTEIYKFSNNKNCTNRNLQIFQQISTNLPTIECTNRNLQIFQQ